MVADTETSILLALYRGARELPAGEFQQYAIRLIRPLLRFESMIWGAGYLTSPVATGSLVPIRAATYEIDPEGFAFWKAINRQDKVIPAALNSPRTTVRFHAPSLYAEKDDAVMRDYTHRFRRDNNLGTVLTDPGAPLIEWCSFYRPGTHDHYTESERASCQGLVEHLSESLKVNQMAQDSAAEISRRAGEGEFAALLDASGTVLSAQNGFLHACRRHWREFDGRKLPATALHQLTSSPDGCYRARSLTLRLRRMAEYLWVTASPQDPEAGLPPRRMDVAVLFAKGMQTKEIARLLCISPSTVRNQLAASYRSLRVSNRTELEKALADSRGFNQ